MTLNFFTLITCCQLITYDPYVKVKQSPFYVVFQLAKPEIDSSDNAIIV